MAYRKQITNKRFGTTFAGNPNYDTNSPLGDVVKSLAKITPQFQQYATSDKKKKQDAATVSYQAQIANGLSPDDIEKKIKAGELPELNNVYSGSIIQRQRGLFDAAKVTNNITENIGTFDPLTMDFNEWVKDYLPSDLRGKGNHYNQGFQYLYQPFLAEQNIKTATALNQSALDRKRDNVFELYDSTTGVADIFTKQKLLREQVVSEEGEVGYIYTNNEINDHTIGYVEYVGNKAETVEEIERAISILTHDRGEGAGGNKLGSLLNSGSDSYDNVKTSQIYSQLLQKRERLFNKKIDDERIAKEQENTSILKDALELTRTGEMTTAAYVALEKRIAANDGSLIGTFNQVVNSTYKGKAIPSIVTEFEQTALNGEFRSAEEVFTKGIELGIPLSVIEKTEERVLKMLADEAAGITPIYTTNTHYKEMLSQVDDIIDVNVFTNDVVGALSDIEKKFALEATSYIQGQILDQEAEWAEAGVTPTNKERQDFANNLREYITTRFGETGSTQSSVIGTGNNVRNDEQGFSVNEIVEDRTSATNNIVTSAQNNFSELQNATQEDGNVNQEIVKQNIDALQNMIGEGYINIRDADGTGITQFLEDIFVNLDDSVSDGILQSLGIDTTNPAIAFQRLQNYLLEGANAQVVNEDSTNTTLVTAMSEVPRVQTGRAGQKKISPEFIAWYDTNKTIIKQELDRIYAEMPDPNDEGEKPKTTGRTRNKNRSPYQLWLIENKAILDIEDKIEKYESLI